MTSEKQRAAEKEFRPTEKKLKGQKADILIYIYTHGSITPAEAWEILHCTKLATRIGEIERRSGYAFNREKVKAGDTSFMRYSFPRGLTAIHYLLPEDCEVAEALMRVEC